MLLINLYLIYILAAPSARSAEYLFFILYNSVFFVSIVDFVGIKYINLFNNKLMRKSERGKIERDVDDEMFGRERELINEMII